MSLHNKLKSGLYSHQAMHFVFSVLFLIWTFQGTARRSTLWVLVVSGYKTEPVLQAHCSGSSVCHLTAVSGLACECRCVASCSRPPEANMPACQSGHLGCPMQKATKRLTSIFHTPL